MYIFGKGAEYDVLFAPPVVRVMIFFFRHQEIKLLIVRQQVIGIAPFNKRGVPDNFQELVYIGFYSFDIQLLQGPLHSDYCFRACCSMGNDLAYHGIIHGQDTVTLAEAKITPNAVIGWQVYDLYDPG